VVAARAPTGFTRVADALIAQEPSRIALGCKTLAGLDVETVNAHAPILDPRSSMLDPRSSILDPGFWICRLARRGALLLGAAFCVAAAAVRAIADLLPHFFPFFAPGEGTAAGRTDLGGQIALLAHFHSESRA
jgi:hypothetical protein